MYFLYRILLTILHTFYSCIQTVLFLWCFFSKRFENFWYRAEFKDDVYYISRCLRGIKKIPSHLAFILVNEELISFEDLSNLVVWSLAAGVSFVTLYDQDGLLKRCENKLRSEVSKRTGGENITWGISPLTNGKIPHTNGVVKNGTSQHHKNGTNGTSPGRTPLRVVLLSREDGRPRLVQAATVLASKEEGPPEGGVDETIHRTDWALHKLNQLDLGGGVVPLPDPDMAVWCGTLACNTGFLPWHIRITEFFALRSHVGANPREFVSLLRQYSRCEQRLGK